MTTFVLPKTDKEQERLKERYLVDCGGIPFVQPKLIKCKLTPPQIAPEQNHIPLIKRWEMDKTPFTVLQSVSSEETLE